MMDTVQEFAGTHPIWSALLAACFTWGLTALGAAMVWFFPKENRAVLDTMLGFTGGVMMAASFWSLLQPAIDQSPGEGFVRVVPAAVGFVGGSLFVYALDKVLPHLHLNFPEAEAEGVHTSWRRTTLLVLAITLHNIPEGLAVGVLFGAAGTLTGAAQAAMVVSAVSLAIGIGIQNFPEGFAVAMPLRREGWSRLRCFWYGQLSAIVEPMAAVLGAAAVGVFTVLLPYALAFAAGAMIYVVVEEVIPETQRDRFTDIATLGFIAGFVVMMSLDAGLA